jgi:hypothetical protein
MNQKFLELLNKANATWKPVIQWAITIGIILAVVVYPFLHMVLSIWGINVDFPKEISDNLFTLITGAGVLVGLRITEKKLGVTNVH